MRTAVARQDASSYIRFLTPQRAIVRFLTAPCNLFRYFDSQGEAPCVGAARAAGSWTAVSCKKHHLSLCMLPLEACLQSCLIHLQMQCLLLQSCRPCTANSPLPGKGHLPGQPDASACSPVRPLLAGLPKYAGEYERIMGQKRACTTRRANKFAQRSKPLVVAYGATMAASYLLLMFHALSLGPLTSLGSLPL